MPAGRVEFSEPAQQNMDRSTTLEGMSVPIEKIAEEFRRDGAAVLRGVVSAEEIEGLRSGIDTVIAHPSHRAKVASAPDDPGFFIEDFCRWRDISEFERFLSTTRLTEIAARLMGSTTVTMYHDHVLVKEPGTRQRTPWHQDQPYYDVEGRQNVSFWIPVDPVPIDCSLELVVGTHVGPWLMPRSFLDNQARWFPEGTLSELGDIDGQLASDPSLLRRWALQPGDAVAFHMLTVHGAPGVSGANRRRVFSLRVLGDDMVYAPRDWTTSPDFSGVVDHEHDCRVAGQRLTGEWFPELWPKAL